MKRLFNRLLLVALALAVAATVLLWRRAARLERERDRYRQNTETLLADVERRQIDSARMALDVRTLRLTVAEFEEYRAEDAELIRRLGLRIKDLEAAARHRMEVEARITAPVRDSVIVRDTVRVAVKSVEMINPHIEFKGIIEDSTLRADVRIPVTLHQAVVIEYKHKFLWWRWKVKGVRQVITSDNPYVEVKYSEYIRVEKRKRK
ncbi:DUF6549 family protein [Alistipes onderdonkii]|jgi:hypothetical protein|uniref:DUF6549 family protein n=1 Tax=Alistipes onderdonkii TaxID=328813 RepID=UPI0011420A40|nr:DUF6549 family protein [Alistipes onderdonkii]